MALWLTLGVIVVQLVQFREARVTQNGVSMERPVRRADGSRSRFVLFSEITDAEPKVVQGAEMAILTLRDGTKAQVLRSMFGTSGLGVMEGIFGRLGRSYQAEMKAILLAGAGGSGFRTVRVKRFEGDKALLRISISTYSGSEVRRLSPKDVEEIERVSTPYAGLAHLVTLKDGTRFLIPSKDPETHRLTELPGWRALVRSPER